MVDRAGRVAQDPAPLIHFHSQACVPVWKSYYALIGLEATAAYSFKVATKQDYKLVVECSAFTIGLIQPDNASNKGRL